MEEGFQWGGHTIVILDAAVLLTAGWNNKCNEVNF